MLLFSNPDEIDSRLITTMGVNVKTTDNPLGHFGTGLKYAIATLLRNGCRIKILSGRKVITFSTVEESVRGRAFDFILMNTDGAAERLGFTTDLGPGWRKWMAYRELRSNCIDEQGEVQEVDDNGTVLGASGATRILVWGLDEIHKQGGIFLSPKLLWSNGKIEVHEGRSQSIFHKGVRVKRLDKPSLFTYNILEAVELTEDRTIGSMWLFGYYLTGALGTIDNQEVVKAVTTASEEFFEHGLDWSSSSEPPSKAFVETVGEAIREAKKNFSRPAVTSSAFRHYEAEAPKHHTPQAVQLDPEDKEKLSVAIAAMRQAGLMLDAHDVQVVDKLASHQDFDWIEVEGENNKIRLTRDLLTKAPNYLLIDLLKVFAMSETGSHSLADENIATYLATELAARL